MQILTVVGARPQFVKASMVSLRARNLDGVNELILHTGQHYDFEMSDVFFKELDLREPDFRLEVGSMAHGAQTGRMLEGIETILMETRPDWVLVYGDTNSTIAGSLAAAKLHIPVAHVEAGLRSFDRHMPEEVNRVLTDHASNVLFTPTARATDQLIKEGISRAHIYQVGDVMLDVAMHFGDRAERLSKVLDRYSLKSEGFLLATIHRARNTDNVEHLKAIVCGLIEVAEEWPVVLPLHPRTRSAMVKHGLLDLARQRMRVIDPVGFQDMMMLEKHARAIVTDSGGVQKEAFFQRTPCITLRDETEWLELVELGWNRLVPPKSATAVSQGILEGIDEIGVEGQPYGNGDAARRILDTLASLSLAKNEKIA